MEAKQIILGLAVIVGVGVLAAAGLYLYTPTAEIPGPIFEEVEDYSFTTYSSEERGLMFDYPANYTLETHEQGNEERTWTQLVLIDSELLQQAIEQGHSEGPPAIAIQVFDNIEEYTVEEWIKGISYSNYKLAFDETLTQVMVGGEEGLAYRYSGLYETNATVVAHDSRMYLLSVDWLTPQDANIHDFDRILESVIFY